MQLIGLLVFLVGSFIATHQSEVSQSQKENEWKGKLRDGKIITQGDLLQIIEKHKLWLSSAGKEGQRADLIRAELSRVDLSGSNLNQSAMSGANLTLSKLNGASLNNSDLVGADLSGAELNGVYLSEADLREANLSSAKLSKATLIRANLSLADLHMADLTMANLSQAILDESDISRADLSNADLRGTTLRRVIADFANFEFSWFEPEDITGIRPIGARGLSKINFVYPHKVVELREETKRSGFRSQETALTSALWKYRRRETPKLIRIFEDFVLGGLLTDYGAQPWRSLQFLAVLILIPFVPIYTYFLKSQKRSGIWITWKGRQFRVKSRPSKMWLLLSKRWKWIPIKWVRDLRVTCYFSLLSAFHIGWRELNVGNWITRLQCRDYTLHGTDWVRTVSGVQSLISVYLLALWALTYFGNFFE